MAQLPADKFFLFRRGKGEETKAEEEGLIDDFFCELIIMPSRQENDARLPTPHRAMREKKNARRNAKCISDIRVWNELYPEFLDNWKIVERTHMTS